MRAYNQIYLKISIMKKLICLVIISISIGIFLDGCKDDDPTARETTTDALINDSKTWTSDGVTVTLDGNDVSDSFLDFQMDNDILV